MRRILLALVPVLIGACTATENGVESETLTALAETAAVVPSTRAGMGAIPSAGATLFRVWAPNAKAVAVAGEFNAWSTTANPLASEGNGNWSVDVAGAKVGQKYKFVVTAKDGSLLWRLDPRAGQAESSNGAGIVHDPNGYSWRNGFTAPPFNEQVVYELHVGTYNDVAGGAPGTWRSAAAKLDHIRDLGANVVEVMPIAEFAGDFSWGYNPALIFAPESAYGAPEDMKFFVDEAHARGIAVVLDVVYNHLGPDDLSAWCFDGECLGKGGVYFYTDGRVNTPWGGPRPDYGRSEVRDYIRDALNQWLDEYRVDGLRHDATKFVRTVDGNASSSLADGYGLLRALTDGSHQRAPGKIQIAEDFGLGDVVSQPTVNGGLGFDTQWDGGFVYPLRAAVEAVNDGDRSMAGVRGAVTNSYNGQATQRTIYTESHDEVANGKSRVPETISPGNPGSYYAQKRSTLAAAILFTSPGIPLMFEGQEWLEGGSFKESVPIDWSRDTTYSGIRQLYTDLIHLRRNWANDTRGLRGNGVNVFHTNEGAKVIAYHRWQSGGPGDDVVVVANFSAQSFPSYTIGMPRAGTWHVRFNGDAKAYSALFGGTSSSDVNAAGPAQDGLANRATVSIGPYSAVVFSQ